MTGYIIAVRGLGGVLGSLLGRPKPVKLEVRVERPLTLILHLDAASARVYSWSEMVVSVRGRARSGENVRFRLEEEDGRLYGHLYVEAASVEVRAPIEALGAILDSSSLKTSIDRPLRYISVNADSSGVKILAKLRRGGGLYARLDASALSAMLEPEGPGRYWVEVEAEASGVRVEFAGRKRYRIKRRDLDNTSLRVAEPDERADVEVEASVTADSSSVKLL